MEITKKPSVLMFGWEFPPFNSGGLGVACEGLSKALAASGAHVSFVLPFKVPIKARWCDFIFANEDTEFKNAAEILNYVSGYQSATASAEFPAELVKGMRGGSLLERVLIYGKRAPAIARRVEHSVIHAHDWLTYPAGVAAKRASGRPLVVHIHATEFDRSGSDSVNQAIYEIEKMGFEQSDLIVAVSERTRQQVIKKYGINPNKVKVVYNGVEYSENNSTLPDNLESLKREGNSIVLFVGRITLQKGPDYFVSMAERVLRYERKTIFVVSGSGDMEGEMIRAVSKKGLSSHFIFCGFLRGEELSSVFQAADMFVMPSVSEPFGIVPLEAMLANTPVLVSKESGVSEILSTALKSHFWDVDDMTDKVVSVLRHKKLSNHLSVNGKKEAKTIHWKKAADTLISLYNSLDNVFSLLLFPSAPTVARTQVSRV